LGTNDMVHLFDAAKSVDARMILVGDRKQHRAVAAGEPLKLLEQKAGLPAAEVKQILRQTGEYKKATEALSEGQTEEELDKLDRLDWIKEVSDDERYKALADAYLSAIGEKKRGGENKTALVVSPTHAEADRITQTIRETLKAQGKLGDEHAFDVWKPAHLTEA